MRYHKVGSFLRCHHFVSKYRSNILVTLKSLQQCLYFYHSSCVYRASAILSTSDLGLGGGGHVTPMMHWTSMYRDMGTWGICKWHLVTTTEDLLWLIQLRAPSPLVLTSGGNHRSMYGWKVGNTHPTRMLSCSWCLCNVDWGGIEHSVFIDVNRFCCIWEVILILVLVFVFSFCAEDKFPRNF